MFESRKGQTFFFFFFFCLLNFVETIPLIKGYTPTVTSTPAQRSSALLLLTLKERYRLTQAGVNFSVDQVKQVVENVLDEVKSSVQERVGDDHYVDDCFDVDPFH